VAAELEADERPVMDVLLPLLSFEEPKAAVTTTAGHLVRFQTPERALTLLFHAIPRRIQVDARLEKTTWRYVNQPPAGTVSEKTIGESDVLLGSYANSVSPTIHQRAAIIDDADAQQRRWFEAHELHFRRIVIALRRKLVKGWTIDSRDIVHRVGLLRGEYEEESHLEVIPGESYRIRIAGGSEMTQGDVMDLRYDLAGDRYTLNMRFTPRLTGKTNLAAHSEVLVLAGDGTGQAARYRLQSWKDGSLGVTYSPKSGGRHPLFARVQEDARRLLSFFPRKF